MRKIIKDTIEQPIKKELTPQQYEIVRQLMRLDSVASIAESEWGVGTIEAMLEKYYPDISVKWSSQKDKLNKAIVETDDFSIGPIVDGCIRAYTMFGVKLREAGCEPRKPTYWSVGMDGITYLIVNNYVDAMALHRPLQEEFKGCVILTLEELLRVYHARATEVYGLHGPKEFECKKNPIDWSNGGDDIPL